VNLSIPTLTLQFVSKQVGGEFAATVIRNHMAARGRVAVSGALSSYNEKAEWSGMGVHCKVAASSHIFT
jgi:NADPH-dependent curcumin reductase CurA